MNHLLCELVSVALLGAGIVSTATAADDFKLEDSFTSLFNGKDLSGWEYGPVPVSKKPIIEKLEGKTATKDKVFEVSEGLIVASGKKVMALYTAKEYNKAFVFKLEFRTTTDNKKNNSGIYIRGPQLQLDAVTEGGLTGVFKKLTKFKPGDWNEIEIAVKGTEAICKCNGEVIGKPMKIPETGTIGLQSEIGKFEFRRIRVMEVAVTHSLLSETTMRIIAVLLFLATPLVAAEPKVHHDLVYAKSKNERQTLDVYAPAEGKNHPVVVWIHGGGWHSGDKKDVKQKPQAFTDKGFVFVSINYRLQVWTDPHLSPGVTIKQIAEDVARAIHWTHDHAGDYGGDPKTIFVMGHSAGAQLAALVCTDDRYLKAENLSLSIIEVDPIVWTEIRRP